MALFISTDLVLIYENTNLKLSDVNNLFKYLENLCDYGKNLFKRSIDFWILDL